MPRRSSGASTAAPPLVPLGSAAAAALIVLKMVRDRRSTSETETASALRALAPTQEAVDLTVQDALFTKLKIGINVEQRVSSEEGVGGETREGAHEDPGEDVN